MIIYTTTGGQDGKPFYPAVKINTKVFVILERPCSTEDEAEQIAKVNAVMIEDRLKDTLEFNGFVYNNG